MTQHLHPQRETYPLVSSNDELVLVFRDHIPTAHAPVLYIKALTPNVQWRVDSARSLDERSGYRVADYTAGAGDTVTITVNGGAPTALTEGVDFAAAISNENTALEIAAAINTAAVGVTAVASGAYVLVTADAGTTEFTLASGDVTAWESDSLASVGAVNTIALSGSSSEITLPSGSSDPLKKVSFLRVLNGRVSVDLRSPVPVRTYLRQPYSLSPTTGHDGGWPTSPSPAL